MSVSATANTVDAAAIAVAVGSLATVEFKTEEDVLGRGLARFPKPDVGVLAGGGKKCCKFEALRMISFCDSAARARAEAIPCCCCRCWVESKGLGFNAELLGGDFTRGVHVFGPNETGTAGCQADLVVADTAVDEDDRAVEAVGNLRGTVPGREVGDADAP